MAIDVKREIEVPWDDLRAARVQKNALAAFKAAKEKADAAPKKEDSVVIPMRPTRARNVAVLVALVAIAAAIALFVRFSGGEDFVASTLHYRDGSRSLMSSDAQVHVVEDSEDHVAVQQTAGRVRYDITKRPNRNFVVQVDGVTITVLGTIFDVDIQEDQVKVEVERGRVRVESAGRRLELTAGEHATLKTDATAPAPETADTEIVDEALEEADHKGERVPATQDEPTAPSASVAQNDEPPTAAEWMRRADTARASGDGAGALRALRSLIAAYPTDARATLALFTIGKVERQRGNHAAAARAFEQCGAALKGDAIAEAAASWQAAGNGARARAAAQRYLQMFPKGVHAEAMRGF